MTSNKTWRFILNTIAEKQFTRLDKTIQKRIINYIDKIIRSPNPKTNASQLTGDKSQLWRYRVGDYRIIVRFEDHNMVILAIKIAHRRDVYTK